MTDNEILQEFKIKYIDNTWSYSDGAKSLLKFFYNYCEEMSKKYKTYKPLLDRLEVDDFNIILYKNAWYFEYNTYYNYITKALYKKIKSIMKQLDYKYLYDI